jgi:hypothetical protein
MKFFPVMRRPLAIFASIPLFLCAIATVQAQSVVVPVDHRTMLERFTSQADHNKTYTSPDLKAFGTTKAFTGVKNNDMKSFNLISGFHTKNYTANSYNAGAYWAGNFQYKTTDANLNSHNPISSLLRLFKTKPLATKSAVAGNTVFQTRADPLVTETSHNIFRGKLQNKLDKEGVKALQGSEPMQAGDSLHPMTMDEVRELLDKTK